MSNISRPISNVIIYDETGTEVGNNSNPLVTSVVDTVKNTYSASAGPFAAAGSPTDVFTITGSASKVVRITRISFSGTQTTGAMRDVLIIKRSTANTGGTSATPNKVPHDSTFSAATATVRNYTANPSGLGTTVGTIRAQKVFIGAATALSREFCVDWGPRNSQAPVLRGTGEVLAVNLNGVTSTGNSLSINIEWTEED